MAIPELGWAVQAQVWGCRNELGTEGGVRLGSSAQVPSPLSRVESACHISCATLGLGFLVWRVKS
jgi:hypothetical protein